MYQRKERMMKRSEMVLEIASELLLSFPIDKKLPNWDEAQVMADAILKMQEKEGMLPPTIDCEDWIDCEDGQGFVVYAKNEWEPED